MTRPAPSRGAALTTLILTGALAAAAVHADPKYAIDSFERKQLMQTFYAEGSAIGDLNKDGHPDAIVGPIWFAGPDFNQKHEIYPPKPFDPKGYSDNFFSFTHDVDGDGWTDVLVLGFPGAESRWYRNPGKDKHGEHWPMHVAIRDTSNESPTFTDLTGDGKPEIVCMSGGHIGFATPGADPTQEWTFHPISSKGPYQRFTHGLGVGDVNGDGRNDILEKNGWWEQPADWDGKTEWTHHAYQFSGAGGAQMFAYDVDGDGDNDVITSLAAHGYGLAWFEQVKGDGSGGGKIDFKRHMIMTERAEDWEYGVAFSQLHALELVDMDGNGLLDIVTGKRWWAHGGKDPGGNDTPVLYWFRLVRENDKARYIPEPIDNDSGVGTQVTVGKLNGDDLPDVLVGNKRGAFVFLHERREVSQHDHFWLNHPAMKAMGKTPRGTAAGMTLPEGFKANVAVAEPDMHQPIAFTIDERGRLWVAENYSYPNWAPEGNDRIVVFEDTTGDGYHDKRTVFYDKLNFVSGIEVGFGGVFVGSPPNLLFIPDRNRDDKPDGPPEVLLDGWGHHDTHETLNSFNWGPDGWLYGCHGVFTHSNVGRPGAPDGERERINAGVWRYHPIRKTFEVFAHGTSNPWGVDFDEHGECFITACVIPHAYHIVPGGRYQRQAGNHFNPHTYDDIKTMADHRHFAGGMRDFGGSGYDESGGGHAHAGAMIYLGDQFPPQYRGKLFMNNIHGNRINMDILKPHGSTFVASHGKDFMLANDKWYRGLYLRAGPDGSVYASDWYDRRACHQQRPNDRTNGRIYRISYGDAQPPQPGSVDLSKMSDLELAKLQSQTNRWHVNTARRLLMERSTEREIDKDALGELTLGGIGEAKTPQRLQKIWAAWCIGVRGDHAILSVASNDDAHVRAWGVRFIAESQNAVGIDKYLPEMAATDASPVVRRQIAAGLQKLDTKHRWAIASALLARGDDASDPMIPLLIWYGVEPLVGQDPARALALIDGSKIPLVNQFIVRRAAADEAGIAALAKRLGATDDAGQLRMILQAMRTTLESRAKATMPEGWDAVYTKLMKADDAAVRDDARLLAVKFGDPRVFPELRKVVMDGDAKMDNRTAAIDILVNGHDKDGAEAFKHALGVPPLRLAALRGLEIAEDPHAPAAIINHYKQFNADEKAAAIATLTSRPAYAQKLLEAIGAGTIPRLDLPVHAVRQMLKFDDGALAGMIEKHWGKMRDVSADKAAAMQKWKQQLNEQYMATANLSNGRAVFARTCAACHTLFDQGGGIGPDLTGSNRAELDYVLENVVDPNATIGADYQLTIFTLKDGRVVSGMVRGENDSAVTVQTADTKTVVPLEQVEQRQTLPMSMMPEGLFAALQDSEVRDLVAYLRSPRQVPLPGEGPYLNPATGRIEPGEGGHAVEGEAMKVVKKTGGNVRPQPMGGFPADKWSGDAHLWWTDGQPGQEIALEIPVTEPGRFELTTAMTMARDYGIVQLFIDGKPAGPPIDLFSKPVGDRSDVKSTGPVSLGTHELKPGSTLTIKMTGAHPDAEKRYMFAIDYLVWKKAE